MENIILSVHPEYVDLIIKGIKKFDYRKIFSNPKRLKEISFVYVYSTLPIQLIECYFEFKGILFEDKEIIWNKTKEYAGIDKIFYDEYFKKKQKAKAIIIDEIMVLKESINPFKRIENFVAPQSYSYINFQLH